MTKEIQIVRHPIHSEYGCDDNGRIFSFVVDKSGREMTQRASQGYLRVSIAGESWLAHAFILECRDGLRPDGFVCRHLSGDPYDNRMGNITWGTIQENSNDRVAHGNSGKLLNPQSAENLYRDAHSGKFTYKELVEKYQVSQIAVWKVKTGRSWKAITSRIQV